MKKKAYIFGEIRKYTKSISITLEDLEWIKKTKGKKTAAGKLKEIIEFYKSNNN